VRALLCSSTPLDGELQSTLLFRSNVKRHHARTAEEARQAARKLRPEIVLVDRDLPGAAALVKDLREDPLTRRSGVVALARGDFAASELLLLEAGFPALALNVSVNGILLETLKPLRVGDDLSFALSLPDGGGEVSGTATVVRHAAAPGRYGVELTHVKGDGRVRIKRFVDRL
jgi:hypothetical protein